MKDNKRKHGPKEIESKGRKFNSMKGNDGETHETEQTINE